MGSDKASLPIGGGETLLQRVVRSVCEVVAAKRVVCVAAPGQQLPPLPTDLTLAFDATPHRGPLAAMATGLRALPRGVDVVFLTGCDAPGLLPGFMERMFVLLQDHEIAAPHDGHHWQPLAAVYRTSILPQVEMQLAAGQSSLAALLQVSDTLRVPTDELRDIDPRLASLDRCNTPQEYRDAVRKAGLTERQ